MTAFQDQTGVHVSGVVQDESPATVLINVSGGAMGQVHAQADGTFNAVLAPTGMGNTLFAYAYDNEGLSSDVLNVLYSSTASSLTMNLTWLPNRQVMLTGQLNTPNAAGKSIFFAGQVSGSTTAKADGTYSVVLPISSLGTIVAQFVDDYGQLVQTSVSATNAPPVISEFKVTIAPGGFYTFTGKVSDEAPEDLVVTFGGLNGLQGKTATVQPGGTFSITVELQPGDDGEATVSVADWWSVTSNIATCLIV